MLERIREGAQGPWAMVIVAVIVLSFVFTGVGSYLSAPTNQAAAEVNGEEITVQALDSAYQNERARMESQFGEAVSSMFANETYLNDFKSNILERLINDKLVEQHALEMGLRVGDEQINSTILSMPEFKIGDTFNKDRYQALIRQAGYNPSDFKAYMRTQMAKQQLNQALSATEFSLPLESQRVLNLSEQTRNAEIVEVPAIIFESDVAVTDEALQSFYNANLSQYDTEELVSLAYVSLSIDDLMEEQSVSDIEVEEYYQANISQYKTDEERKVSHILIEFGEDKDTAKDTINALLNEIDEGADFAKIAVENSADTFSAENGGDLDFVPRGIMDTAFEEAAYSLASVGDVSEVVETSFGYHLIKLTDIKEQQITALSEVRDDIKDQLLTDQASEQFFELQQSISNLAFEIPDSLEEVAARINKPIQTTALFQRGQLPASINYPQVENVAFSSELIDDQVNSELLEISDTEVMVVRVATHKPQRTLPFDEVSSQIRAQLVDQKAQDAAYAWALSIEQALLESKDASELLSSKSLSWQKKELVKRNDAELGADMVSQLFTLGEKASDSTSVLKLSNGNVGIIKLLSVNNATIDDIELLKQFEQRFTNVKAQGLFQAFVESLREKADVVIF